MSNSLGTALRDWRERVDPLAVGVVVTGRRRAPGLRREELAELAGVSSDYVKRLEQGRGRPSVGVVTALAGALRLDRVDYEYFCSLAGHAATGAGPVPRRIGPGPQRLLDRLDGTAVCLCDAAWTVLAANESWQALQCGVDTPRRWNRNVAWRFFVLDSDSVRRTPERRSRFAATLAGDLRRAARRYPGDQELSDLIGELTTASTSFRALWDRGSTARHDDDQVIIAHPEAGDITVDCDILTIEDGDLRAIVFTAPSGSGDAVRLRTAGVAGPRRAPSWDELGQAQLRAT